MIDCSGESSHGIFRHLVILTNDINIRLDTQLVTCFLLSFDIWGSRFGQRIYESVLLALDRCEKLTYTKLTFASDPFHRLSACAGKMGVRVALGLKKDRALREKLLKISTRGKLKAELERRRDKQLFRISGAYTGVLTNTVLFLASPAASVGVVVNGLQVRAALHSMNVIEQVAREAGINLLEGHRDRYSIAGVIVKLLLTGGFFTLDELMLAFPALNALWDIIGSLKDVGEFPAQIAQGAMGLTHEPNWDDLPRLGWEGIGVIGLAGQVNAATQGAEAAAERLAVRRRQY